MKYLKALFSVILGFFFLWLALKNAVLSEAASRIFQLSPLWLAVSVFSFFYTQFIRAARWHMLSAEFAAGFAGSFKVFYIGLFANYVLPFRLGEFSRPLIMKKTHNAPFSATVGVIFVERLLDLSGQIFLLIFVLWFSPLPVNNRLVEYIKIALSLIAFIFAAGFAALKFISKGGAARPRPASSLNPPATGLKAKISILIKSFNEGAGIYGDKKRLAAAFIYTLISWFVSAATIMFSMKAIGIELASPFLSACFVQAAISIALVIPPPPGFAGTFHYFCMEGLMFYAVKQNTAAAYAVFFHAMQIILIALPAAFFMAAYGIGFGDFMKKDEGEDGARGSA